MESGADLIVKIQKTQQITKLRPIGNKIGLGNFSRLQVSLLCIL